MVGGYEVRVYLTECVGRSAQDIGDQHGMEAWRRTSFLGTFVHDDSFIPYIQEAVWGLRSGVWGLGFAAGVVYQ